MRNFASIVVALLLLVLSANAEGQAVKLQPVQEGEMGTNRTYVDMNDQWIACTGGTGILVYDRKMSLSDFPIPLWLDDGSVGINPQGVVDIILHGNFLIVGGDNYGRGGIIGVWDLLNLSPNMVEKIGSKYYNPSGLYHPQNIRIDHRGLKRVFINREYNLVGAYDENGLITVYEMFGNNAVLQEFYIGTDALSLAFSDDFVVLGKKTGVQLFQYNPSIQIYEDIGTIVSWDNTASPGSLEIRYADKGRLGLVTNNDAVFLIIGTRDDGIEIISLNKKTKKLLSRKILWGAMDIDRIYDTDGEFMAFGGGILHVPSAQVVGTFSLLLSGSATMNACCIYDSGSRFQMVTFGYISTDPRHWFYYFSEYDEPLFKVSTPKKVRRGTVQLLGSSRVFRGGSAVLVATADPGKRVKSIQKKGFTKKTIKRETTSLVFKIKKIKEDTGLKKVVFASSNMEQYKVQLPNALIIGRPTPDEPNPKKWYYNLGVGNYVGFYTDSGGFFWFSIIKVKPGGRIATVPIFF